MTTNAQYMITEVNVTTGGSTIREMTAQEKADYDDRVAASIEAQAAQAAAAEAKAAAAASAADKLAKLGLTAEEIAALRG